MKQQKQNKTETLVTKEPDKEITITRNTNTESNKRRE